MIVQEKEITLKNGQNVIFRSLGVEDTEAVIRHIQITSGETHFIAHYPEESTMIVEEEQAFLKKLAEDKNDFMISAFIDDRLVANVGVQKIQNLIKFRHRAGFGTSIREKVCSLGFGTIILQETTVQAQNTDFEQLELEVFFDNPRARHLYEKIGFQETRICPRAYKLKDDTYRDKIQMVYYLPQKKETV